LTAKKICKILINIDCLNITLLFEIHPSFGGNLKIIISNPCETHKRARFMYYHHVVAALQWNESGLQFQMSTKLNPLQN